MDLTLRDILALGDKHNNILLKTAALMSSDSLQKTILLLQKNIKNLQAVSMFLADISNNYTIIALEKSKKIKYIDPMPCETDHVLLREQSAEIKTINNIDIPVKYVENINNIPISPIYYINTLKQFAININGVIVKGNLGNISNYKDNNTARCQYGKTCKNFLAKTTCKYYHAPEDYKAANFAVVEEYRNFTPGSWVYNNRSKFNNYYIRHIGSKDTLKADIHKLKKSQYIAEVDTREHQLMHDLLIYYILFDENLLSQYKRW